ncbi:helix-turn-helix domain-containing protein [Moritella yayanosii]|uniref:L-rhamnose operon transcriptional activator RhaR n=1 Tax=Moritella yayanosii TaxID=69539 RepID=A0A330LQC6_9GAMM
MNNDTAGSEFSLLDCFGGIEYVKASFKDQHFSKHVHEGYAIGVIDRSLVEHLRMIFDYSDNHGSKLLLETLIFAFFTKLLLKSSNRNINLDDKVAGNKICLAREYLDEFFDTNISLDELAIIGNTNKYTLIRQFKDRWGMAPHQYQVQLRIHRAKGLLRTGIKPVDVAAICGFYDQSHLASHFKKALGTTPNSYRRFMYERPS